MATTLDLARLRPLLEKTLSFARTAEAVAQRLVGKVRTLAAIAFISAVWLAYYLYVNLELSLGSLLLCLVLLLLPALVLSQQFATLKGMVGLPERITDAATRMTGKASEWQQFYESAQERKPRAEKPTVRQMWGTAKSLWELKSLGNEATELFALLGGALTVANPLFLLVFIAATAVTVVLLLAALITGAIFAF